MVRFQAGDDAREALWTFDAQSRSVQALEDEARWLSETELGLQSPAIKERWCNSYKSQRYCPKNVCFWVARPAPGLCTARGGETK